MVYGVAEQIVEGSFIPDQVNWSAFGDHLGQVWVLSAAIVPRESVEFRKTL